MSPRKKLGVVVAMIVAGLDPWPQVKPATLTVSQALQAAAVAYPHANRKVRDLSRGLIGALPAVAAADAQTKAAFRVLVGPYLDQAGLVLEDPYGASLREAFDYACDPASVSLRRLLDDYSWLAQRTPTGTYRDRQLLRDRLRRALGQ